MASSRQIVANQQNAQKSTGPRSTAGRMQSSRNARRHGLAVNIASLEEFQEDIDRLTKAIERDHSGQICRSIARAIAEAELDVLRVRRVKATVLQALIENPHPLICEELDKQLASLDRYERRALSRRKRAMNSRRSFTMPDLACSVANGFKSAAALSGFIASI